MSRSDTASTSTDPSAHAEAPARSREQRGGKRGAGAAKSRAPSSGLRRQLVEQEILERAAQLFAERGFAGTTVGDIAEALGMSRPALYYYVKSKDVLLARLVENLTITSANEVEAIRTAAEGGPLEKLADMTRALALTAARNPNQAHILAHNKHHLPADLAKVNNDAERTIVRAVMAMLTEGIKSGQVRALDVRTSALAIIGMCLWTAWWSGDEPVEVVADRVAEQAVASVLAAGANREVSDPAELLRAARADLERLQASLDS